MSTNSTGYLNMSYLLPDTAQAIRDYYQRSDWEELFDLISPETAALMFFRLRKASDEIFPHGKWATIQRLESLIEEMDELKGCAI